MTLAKDRIKRTATGNDVDVSDKVARGEVDQEQHRPKKQELWCSEEYTGAALGGSNAQAMSRAKCYRTRAPYHRGEWRVGAW